jgi:hypothetical protein
MQATAVIGTQLLPLRGTISSIVTICTNRKRLKASPAGTAAALAAAAQADLATQWIAAAQSLPRTSVAAELYAGRAFGLAQNAATLAASPLFIISAGLGLVTAETLLPAYGLTVSRGGPESILSKVVGPFDAAEWFSSLARGSLSVGWDKVFCRGTGRVLIALTRPYAAMVAPALASLPRKELERLRLFGAGLLPLLPPSLREAVVPYDDRLDTAMPGTRSDFPQRALLHFVRHIADVARDRPGDCDAVGRDLAPFQPPFRPERPSASDAAILALIKARLTPAASVSGLLRQLRDDDQIACEQRRFAALFQKAKAEDYAS